MKREMDKKYLYVLSFENPLPSGLQIYQFIQFYKLLEGAKKQVSSKAVVHPSIVTPSMYIFQENIHVID